MKKQRRVQVEPTPENIAKVRKECEVVSYPVRDIMKKFNTTYNCAVILAYESQKKKA
jgi:hypothetical protein